MKTIRRLTRLLNCLPVPAWMSYLLIQVNGLAEGAAVEPAGGKP